MAFSRQSGRHGHQHAADAVERLSDRAARLAGVAARAPPQCRFPRHARDRRLADAGQSDGRRDRHLADQARRLDPRSDRGRLKRAISELLEFQTKTAWVMRDGVIISIPAAELVVGDQVVVYPGEMIPVDGEIIDGHAMIDQKTITGEGLPVMRGEGRGGLRRDRHSRRPAHGPRHARRHRHHRRPDRAARRIARRSATRACRTMPKSLPTGWWLPTLALAVGTRGRSPATSTASCRW